MIARTGLCVLGHQLLVLLPQGVHAVDHLLHQLDLVANRILQTMVCREMNPYLRISEPVLVGDVIGDSSLTTRLPPGAPRLQLQLLATLLREEAFCNNQLVENAKNKPSVRGGLPWSRPTTVNVPNTKREY